MIAWFMVIGVESGDERKGGLKVEIERLMRELIDGRNCETRSSGSGVSY